MKACILVGGYGTRLRPLTLSKPKPLIPFCNIPMILHQIMALLDCGVNEIIFLMSQESDLLKKECEIWGKRYVVRFSFCYEETALGTAGPLRLALEQGFLDDTSDEPFFLLNSDIICEYPLAQLLESHRKTGGEGTILVKKMSDCSRYGVVLYDEGTGLVTDFIEKPSTFVGDRINAGIYVLRPSILRRIQIGKCSLEREIFPAVAAAHSLHCAELSGIWMDIGNPVDFLDAVPMFIDVLTNRKSISLSMKNAYMGSIVKETDEKTPCTIIGKNVIDPSAKIHQDAVVGPNCSIASNCVIHKGARIENSVVLSDSTVHEFSCISRSIVGWNCCIGRWTHCINGCVLGKNVHLSEQIILNGIRALPHLTFDRNVLEPQVIM